MKLTRERIEEFYKKQYIPEPPTDPKWVLEENAVLTAICDAALSTLDRPEDGAPDVVPVPRLLLLSMGTDHVVRGGPGPLFGAGWAAACEHWSKKLLAIGDDITK